MGNSNAIRFHSLPKSGGNGHNGCVGCQLLGLPGLEVSGIPKQSPTSVPVTLHPRQPFGIYSSGIPNSQSSRRCPSAVQVPSLGQSKNSLNGLSCGHPHARHQPVEAGWPKLKLSPMTLRKDLSREQRELQWHLVQPCSISFGGSTEFKPSPGITSCQLPI